MILKGVSKGLFCYVNIAALSHVGHTQRYARVQSLSWCGQESVLRIEQPASLQRRFRLRQYAPTDVQTPQVTKHLGQGNFRMWVAIVQHLDGPFKSVDSFKQTALNLIKHPKWML